MTDYGKHAFVLTAMNGTDIWGAETMRNCFFIQFAATLPPTPLKPLYMKRLEGGGRWVAGGSKAENKVVRKNDQERQCDSMATQLKKNRFLHWKTSFSAQENGAFHAVNRF